MTTSIRRIDHLVGCSPDLFSIVCMVITDIKVWIDWVGLPILLVVS